MGEIPQRSLKIVISYTKDKRNWVSLHPIKMLVISPLRISSFILMILEIEGSDLSILKEDINDLIES